MTADKDRTIVVTGATGLQGSAVTRHLLSQGWHVRALTRHPQSEKAKALAAQGAEVVQGDMANAASLHPIFAGASGLFSVQNTLLSGVDGEITQGKQVAAAAKQAAIPHVVYASAGTGARGTGIPSWESKLVIEEAMRELDLPVTILRPMAFMELMTASKFFPAVSTWHIMPKLMGPTVRIGWLCTDDLGAIVAKAFAAPESFIGKEYQLLSDVQSIDECRSIYRAVMGKNPPRFPMPVWMFARLGIVGQDLGAMWRWLHDATLNLDTTATYTLHPTALRVQPWLEQQHTRHSAS